MKKNQINFRTDAKELYKKLSLLHTINKKSQYLPVLEYFLFELRGSGLSISATNLEMYGTVRVNVANNTDVNGMVLIESRGLIDALKGVTGMIGFIEWPGSMEVISDGGTFIVPLLHDVKKDEVKMNSDGGEFPKVPEVIEAFKFSLAHPLDYIGNTPVAVGKDELRPIMNGVHFNLKEGGMIDIVSTNAHLLIRNKAEYIGNCPGLHFTLPLCAIQYLIKYGINGVYDFIISDDQLTFSISDGNGLELRGRLIDGRYPNYEYVIPKDGEYPHKLVISDKKAAIKSLEQIIKSANKTTHQIKFSLNGTVELTAEDIDFNKSARAVWSFAKFESVEPDKNLEIGFNGKFLSSMLGAISGDNVTIELSLPNRAGIMKGDKVAEMGLLMPVALG